LALSKKGTEAIDQQNSKSTRILPDQAWATKQEQFAEYAETQGKGFLQRINAEAEKHSDVWKDLLRKVHGPEQNPDINYSAEGIDRKLITRFTSELKATRKSGDPEQMKVVFLKYYQQPQSSESSRETLRQSLGRPKLRRKCSAEARQPRARKTPVLLSASRAFLQSPLSRFQVTKRNRS